MSPRLGAFPGRLQPAVPACRPAVSSALRKGSDIMARPDPAFGPRVATQRRSSHDSSVGSKKALRAGDKAALLNASSGSCYNPGCAEQLVAWRDGKAVVNFDIAHIRDEFPPVDRAGDLGWRYWPADDLTQDDRNRFENLLLLCKPCHKLVDQVDPRSYDVELLHAWKREAEFGGPTTRMGALVGIEPSQLAAMLIEALTEPPALRLIWPHDAIDADLLSFAARQTSHVGREPDLQSLNEFLGATDSFAWWMVLGEAGTGKSRLALELCLAVEREWHAGFLTESSQGALLGFEPHEPTLIVVDYAAARADWLGDVLYDHASRCSQYDAPLRVLILERSLTESWYAKAVRAHRHTESRILLSCQYANPLEVGDLSDDDLRSLIEDVASSRGSRLSTTEIEDVLERTLAVDPLGRPLFAMAATLEQSVGDDQLGSRDELLRAVLRRRAAQRSELPGGDANWVTELELVTTSLGGIEPTRYTDLLSSAQEAVLPSFPSLAELRARGMQGSLLGVLPDILGELAVLDALNSADVVSVELATAALRLGWRLDSNRYAAFVERATRDHPWHPKVAELLAVSPVADDELDLWFALAPTLVPLLRSSSNQGLLRLSKLMEEYGDGTTERSERSNATFLFHVGNLLHGEGQLGPALHIYSDVIDSSDPAWETVAGCLTNRGVTFLQMDEVEKAKADFSRVIDSPLSSDESKACCLNNRADIRSGEDDEAGSIADRTAVLDLASTTFNRRYIAHARRARSLWQTGEVEAAFNDLAAILVEEDIVVEQKLAARLSRAEWMIELGEPEAALTDLREVVLGRRNFDGVAERAQALLDSLARLD